MSSASRDATIRGAVLFLLGAAALAAGATLSGTLGLLPLPALALGAGLAEAAAARRTGRRRLVASWAPAALGALALAAAVLVWTRAQGPWHTDSGMSWGILVAALAVGFLVFALLVNAIAWAALRAKPAATPTSPPL